MDTFQPVTDSVGESLGLSALVACVPLLAFFIMLIGVKARAHVSAAVALAAGILVAVLGFHMPIELSVMSAFRGGAFGLVPIVWVIVMAIWFYQITVASGRFEDLRRTFDKLGNGDVRVQTILIAFCFGGLLEALAGFGAPVAITATMILALGVKPLKAATVVLLANTAPVAFGAVATPIITAGEVGGRSAEQTANIAAIVGMQTPIIAMFIPAILLFILDGWKGVKAAWAPAFVIGISFAIAKYITANFFVYQLTDVIACIVSLGVAFAFLQRWQPKDVEEMRERMDLPPAPTSEDLPRQRVWMAMLPYAIVTVIFGVANVGAISTALKSLTVKIPWPLLHDRLLNTAGAPNASSGTYSVAVLHNPGTLLLISGLIVALVYSKYSENGKYALSANQVWKELTGTFYRMRWSILTIVLVLGLAYVMNDSGQTIAIGQFVASLGGLYTFLAPLLGWVGTAVTGSDTSANALFSKMQVTAAEQAGINPDLMLAANTTGGVVGKMVSPQSLAIAATAVEMEGKESDIFKAVVGWPFAFVLFVCCLVYLEATALSFTVPVVP